MALQQYARATEEVGLQIAGGVLLGSITDSLFPDTNEMMTSKNAPRIFLEAVGQLAMSSTAAVSYFLWLAGRGDAPDGSSGIGFVPFWVWFFGSQGKLISKINQISAYATAYISGHFFRFGSTDRSSGPTRPIQSNETSTAQVHFDED